MRRETEVGPFPSVTVVGTTVFDNAYLSTSGGQSIAFGGTATITGLAKFDVVNVDNGIARISRLFVDGRIDVEKAGPTWDEWAIPWASILTQDSAWILLAAILSVEIVRRAMRIRARRDTFFKAIKRSEKRSL